MNAFVRFADLEAMFHLLLFTISTHMVVVCWAQDSTDRLDICQKKLHDWILGQKILHTKSAKVLTIFTKKETV